MPAKSTRKTRITRIMTKILKPNMPILSARLADRGPLRILICMFQGDSANRPCVFGEIGSRAD
jgi:hypothetical protein